MISNHTMADEHTPDPVLNDEDEEDEDEDDFSETTDELLYPYVPRIKMLVDIPPWFAAYALTLLAYTFTAVSHTCSRRH